MCISKSDSINQRVELGYQRLRGGKNGKCWSKGTIFQL